MSIKSDYKMYLDNQNYIKSKNTSKFFINQESRYLEPFKIYGNLYYVGDSWVCVHIVDTGDGLLMFDAGNVGSEAMLIHSIWSLGFNPSNVKWIVLSHGHMDHFGAVNFFKRMFGTKIYMSFEDYKMFEENPEQSMIQEAGNCMSTLFQVDRQIFDGDIIKFGNTEVKFYIVSGHTKGCIACFFDVFDKDYGTKRVGFYGGFGFNTLTKDFLNEIGDTSLSMRTEYLNSLKKVCNEKVDIFMGNHTSNVNLIEKREYMIKYNDKNPFLDSTAWNKYLNSKYNELLAFISNE